MSSADDDLRAAMLTAAEQQLVASPDNDIATRAVCEVVGVGQPVLYRLFGDKRGLLDALTDHGLQRYATIKGAREETANPVADLRAGWDQHVEFARQNAALYQLMFAPRPWSQSVARQRIFDLLVATLIRCAAAGSLAIEPRTAAQLILSANVGVALNQIAQPALFDDPALSDRMRDLVFAALLDDRPETEPGRPPLHVAALRLRSQLMITRTDALDPAESALLDRWLQRIDEHDEPTA